MPDEMRAMLDAVVDLSPDPRWIVDASGKVVAFNVAYDTWWTAIGGVAPQLADLQQRAQRGRSIIADVRLIAGGIERTYTIAARAVGSGGVAFSASEVRVSAEEGTRAVELALMHLFGSS